MSDVNGVDGGGLLKGADGKLSFRRIAALCFFVLGAVFGGWGMVLISQEAKHDVWSLLYFVPMLVMLVVGMYMVKLFTMQNVQEIVQAIKGGKG